MRRGSWLLIPLALAGCASLPTPLPPAGTDADIARLITGLADEKRAPSRRAGSQYVLVCASIERLAAKGPAAVAPLRGALAHRSPVVRRNAAIALARLKSRHAREPLLEMLTDDFLSVLEAIAVIDALDGLPGVKEDAAVQERLCAAAESNPALSCAAASELGTIGNPAAATFLVRLLGERPADPDARTAAARSLGQLGLTRAPKSLIAATRDGQAGVRAAAVESLATIGDRQAAPALMTRLDDESLAVQRAAINAVGQLRADEAVGRLLVFLDHRLPSVRGEATSALAALKSVAGLDHALLNDQWRVRRQAVEGLAGIGTDAALKTLRRAVDDRALPVRQATVRALADSKRFAAVPLLLIALEDEAPTLRQAAHLGLCAIAGTAQRYDYSASPAARREGIRAWERWWLTTNPPPDQTPEAVARREREIDEQIAAAIETLSDSDPLTRRTAEHRLKAFGPRALPALERTFDAAAGTFSEAVGERILPAVSDVYRHLEAVRTGDRAGRRAAALALSRLNRNGRVSPTAGAALVPLLERERDPFTRRFLLDVVAAQASGSATRLLVAGLSSVDAWERLKSARLLGRQRDRAAVPALIGALRDRSAMVRRAAVWALGRIGDARAIEPLTRLLEEANLDLRIEAAGALASFRRREGIDELLRTLAHPDWRLRKVAVEKCGEARTRAALRPLGDLLLDQRPAVREAAVTALRAITNRNFGYRPADPPRKRDAAVRRWREFLQSQPPEPIRTRP